MVKTLTFATILAVSLGCLGSIGGALAQQAPIGHRQPTASDVPANDSIRGDANLTDPPQPSKKRARTRRARSDMQVIMKTPNICSNCNE